MPISIAIHCKLLQPGSRVYKPLHLWNTFIHFTSEHNNKTTNMHLDPKIIVFFTSCTYTVRVYIVGYKHLCVTALKIELILTFIILKQQNIEQDVKQTIKQECSAS